MVAELLRRAPWSVSLMTETVFARAVQTRLILINDYFKIIKNANETCSAADRVEGVCELVCACPC